VELLPILSSCLLIVEAKAREKDITVECHVAEQFPMLFGDGLRLKQILINLLGNAVKFTPDGGHVRIDAHPLEQDYAAIIVTDSGIGMSRDEIDTALRPFGQIDTGFNKRHEGTGLGLPIAYALTKLHGGDLRVDSHKGRGTRIRLILPVARAEGGEDNHHRNP
jgi:signal transduction histidine kinase